MHLRTTMNMVALHSGNRDGVVSMDSQVETVPGPQPQRGPPPATGVSDPEHVDGKGRSRATGYNLNICHWNAEGVRTKKLELQIFLKTHNIDDCCIQDTHLSPNHRFSVKGFETFRRDREHGPKGGLFILVKNIYPAAEIHRSGDEDTEVLGIKLMFEGNPLSIYSLYSPPPKAFHQSNVKLPRERACQVREQLTQLQKQPTSDNCMSQLITMKEIEATIKQLKCKKAPGPRWRHK